MGVLKENHLELAVSSSTASFQDLLDSQKELFGSQIDQLKNIVVTQCKLTSVNPLSQEMAACALSIKIGKRPRDLLNPKAIKYMQSVFSIKDAISKKESREISALFGVTATQVREFFNGQRSRVRKFVRLSREKAIRSNACEEAQDEPMCSDPNILVDPVPLNSVGPTSTEGPTCSTQDEVLPGIDDSDKHFLENIFGLMRKEEAFSGQVKLMEWILQIRNSSVLNWFLIKGGVMILATWLSQAAIEEQTSVLHVILKVLCHLPLHKALPAHMSAILQSVNRLRFYRTSDILSRARILLSRWSKVFARSQATKKPNALKSSSDAQDEMLLKQSIGEIMGNELWESKVDIPEETLTLAYESSENVGKLERSQPLKLLKTSADDSNKKLIRGVSTSQNRERRKVQLVEQPGPKAAGRSTQVARPVPATQERPLSADDIQKAKMRAQFMLSKYGKTGTSDESLKVKAEGPNIHSSSQASILLSASKSHVRPKVEEQKKPVKLPSKVYSQQEVPVDNTIGLDPKEPSWKKCKRVQIPWLTPPEVRINSAWRVGSVQNSKEVEVQKNRIRREREIIYRTIREIPSDPKDPWDREMDYDDTLTPQIPTEQLPDVDGCETVVSPREREEIAVTASTLPPQISSNGNMPEPDLELLAVLLQNPELVFALTSGQGGNLSSEETVKLLDMIKANGVSSLGSLTGLGMKAEEKVEVSLPSPTPSSNPVTSGWRPEFAKNPFSRKNASEVCDVPGVAATVSSQEKIFASRLVSHQILPTSLVMPQQPKPVQPLSHQPIPQTARTLPQKRPPPVNSHLHHTAPVHSENIQIPASEMVLNMNNFSVSSSTVPNLLTALSPLMWIDTVGNVKPAPLTVTLNTPEGMQSRPQTNSQPPVSPEPQLLTHSWRARQGVSPNTRSQSNHNNRNAVVGGLEQAPWQPGPPREIDEYIGEPNFGRWSPENIPSRSPEYMPGWSYGKPRVYLGRNYGPERPCGYRGNDRNGNRTWGDRRRGR